MAIIRCPECGKEISDKAKLCPECGFPIQSENRKQLRKEKSEEQKKAFEDSLNSTFEEFKHDKKKSIIAIGIVAAILIIVIIATMASSKTRAIKKAIESELFQQAYVAGLSMDVNAPVTNVDIITLEETETDNVYSASGNVDINLNTGPNGGSKMIYEKFTATIQYESKNDIRVIINSINSR